MHDIKDATANKACGSSCSDKALPELINHNGNNAKTTISFLKTLIETIPNPLFYKDTEGRYLGCNRAFEDFIGKSRDEIIGRKVTDMGPPEVASEYKQRDDELFANPGIQQYEWQVKHSDGTLHDVIFNKATFTDDTGAVIGLVGVILDISARRKLERDIIEISSREQQHFGHILHDTLGQILAGLALQAKALGEKLKQADDETYVEQAKKIAYIANEALTQSRLIAQGLSPVATIKQGLSVALEHLAENTSNLYGVKCSFICRDKVPIYNSETATHLYYIAREAIHNAIRHGRATGISIKLELTNDHGVITIDNNGSPVEKTTEQQRGMGIYIMRYRAEVIGGTLEISSSTEPLRTFVRCHFPNHQQKKYTVIS